MNEELLKRQALEFVASDHHEFVLAASQKGHPGNKVSDAITFLILERYPSEKNKKPTAKESQLVISARKKYLQYRRGNCKQQVVQSVMAALYEAKEVLK